MFTFIGELSCILTTEMAPVKFVIKVSERPSLKRVTGIGMSNFVLEFNLEYNFF